MEHSEILFLQDNEQAHTDAVSTKNLILCYFK